MIIGLYLIICYFGQKNVCCINAPVILESDYRTIWKVDPIVLILTSELDVPILKIDGWMDGIGFYVAFNSLGHIATR